MFEGVSTIRKERPDMSIMIITHHNKVLDYIKPDYVHVLIDGKSSKLVELNWLNMWENTDTKR